MKRNMLGCASSTHITVDRKGKCLAGKREFEEYLREHMCRWEDIIKVDYK
jgi:hypothetical protein